MSWYQSASWVKVKVPKCISVGWSQSWWAVARILLKPKSLTMGKQIKRNSASKSSKRGRKRNAEKNLKRKKKLRSREKSLSKTKTRDLKQKMNNMCNNFKMLSTTSQAKMRQNLRKDEKKANLKGLCENLERLLETIKEEQGEAGKVEVVEDLVCEVEHLVIGQEELARSSFVYSRWQVAGGRWQVHQVAGTPGGRYTRWQVQQVAAKENLETAVIAPAASSKDCCCWSQNLCALVGRIWVIVIIF